jgi:hypothetical protein
MIAFNCSILWLLYVVFGLFIIHCIVTAYGFVMLWRELREADKIGGEK